MSGTVHLGVNAYLWGAREQDRLLVECLAPLVREIRRGGTGIRFWFDRFDARGPHVFALLSIPRAALAASSALLSARLDQHLKDHPSSATLSPAELASRHRECRGKRLCRLDGEAGFAANGSYRLFEHPAGGYPFHLAKGSGSEEVIWSLLHDLSLWSIDRLDEGATTETAARWIAAIDRSLRGLRVARADYWAFHARALIPSLELRLERDGPAVLASLRQAMGHPAARGLVRAWSEERGGPGPWPHLRRLTRATVASSSWPLERRWALLYSLNHTMLKQLGLRVELHIPLVLAAWSLSLPAG